MYVPAVILSSSSLIRRFLATKQEKILNKYRDLFLPLFSAEYKKYIDEISIQGPNQARSYLIASLKYLAACDIEEFLLFSLCTEGTVGVVQGGWKERARNSVRIF